MNCTTVSTGVEEVIGYRGYWLTSMVRFLNLGSPGKLSTGFQKLKMLYIKIASFFQLLSGEMIMTVDLHLLIQQIQSNKNNCNKLA